MKLNDALIMANDLADRLPDLNRLTKSSQKRSAAVDKHDKQPRKKSARKTQKRTAPKKCVMPRKKDASDDEKSWVVENVSF